MNHKELTVIDKKRCLPKVPWFPDKDLLHGKEQAIL